jgi:TP901 family phage tail tape measure protein
VRALGRKVFEVSFHIAGRLASSFTSAFTSASAKAEKLKQETKELKASLRALDREYKSGKISAEQYAAAHQKLASQLEKNVQKQKQLQAQMKKQQQMMKNLNDYRTRAATTAASILPFAAASTASTYAAYSTLNKSMNFEAQLSSIKAVTGLTNEEMQKMRALALKVGADTKYSALEAAQGIEELLKAGISPAIVQAGGLESALNLATAGGLELAEAAEIMSDALNGFKKDGMTAAQAANILAGAANASSTGVREMKYGISAVGPVADGIGVSFKEVNAVLAAFSNNALKGSDAGTSLKTFLQNVQPDTDKTRELFRKFGLTLKDGKNIFFDTNGQLKDMAEVAEILRQKFKHLTDQQRSEVFFELFGTDAVRAANILYKEGAAGIQKMYEEMSKVTALDVAKEKMNNAAGAVEQMSGAFETLQIIAAEGTLPLVKKVALTAAESFERSAPKVEKAGKRIGKALDDILAPFTTDKPKFDALRAKMDPEYLAEYRKELANWNKFKGMDWSDKVIYSLDELTSKIEEWVNGSGGEKFGKIFAKLAEISVNAYVGALKSLVSSSLNQLGQGNFASAAGLGIVANLLTGGLLAKGLWSGGKFVVGKGKSAFDAAKNLKNKPKGTPTPPDTPKGNNVASKNNGKVVYLADYKKTKAASEAAEQVAKSSSKFAKAGEVLSKTGKIAGKALLPLSIATEAYSIYKANDKTKATVQAAGGFAGGWGGAKLGAAIGTAIAPGIGTAIGAALGGLGGYVAGKWLAGKATDAVRSNSTNANTASSGSTVNVNNNAVNQKINSLTSAITNAEQNFRLLTMYTGQASGKIVGSIFPLSQNAQNASHNMSLLTMYVGQASGKVVGGIFPLADAGADASSNLSLLSMYIGKASGWVASLYSIQSGAESVNTALSNLAKRINSTSVPSLSMKATGKVKKYKRGGILRTPHLGMVAEERPESIIPIKRGDNRALALWRETGRLIGANSLMSKAEQLPVASGGSVKFVYAPTIQGVEKHEIEPVLKRDRIDFERQIEEYERKKRRVSFS